MPGEVSAADFTSLSEAWEDLEFVFWAYFIFHDLLEARKTRKKALKTNAAVFAAADAAARRLVRATADAVPARGGGGGAQCTHDAAVSRRARADVVAALARAADVRLGEDDAAEEPRVGERPRDVRRGGAGGVHQKEAGDLRPRVVARGVRQRPRGRELEPTDEREGREGR